MLYFLTKVTGISSSRSAVLKSLGDEYRDYQRTTKVLPGRQSIERLDADHETAVA